MRPKAIFIVPFLLMYATSIFSQQLNEKGTFLISTNPIKLIYGIINLELEYYVSPAISFQVGSEYVIGHYIIKEENHPDFVFRIGPRYHTFYNKDFGNRIDLYVGAFTGYTWSKDFEEYKGFNLGPEIGIKYKFQGPIYINAKTFITSPINDPKIIPGFECLVGYVTPF
ncbi:hypothetical protein ACFLQX_00130 [Bacteroidota bacterium]